MVISLFSESCNSCLLYKIGSFFQGPSRNVVMVTSFLVLLSCSVVNAAPRTRRVPSQRWQVPCGGKNPVEPGLENIWEEVFGEEAFEEDPESLALTYHDMARKATVVKDKIFELRDKMIIERIGSLTLVESLDQGGFSLKGMPQTTAIEDTQLGDDQAYSHLATLTVFLEQSRMDEDTHEPISTSYVPHFREVEEDLYWLLCSLQGAMDQQDRSISQHVTHDVMSVDLRDIPDRMMRRQRDYIILRDSTQVLFHAANHFSRKASSVSSSWQNRLRR